MKNKLRTLLFVLSFIVLLVQLPSQTVRAIDEFDCTVVTEISQDECLALLALYHSTNGPGWIDHTNWLETLTPSEWVGVTVDSGVVTQLILMDNGLSGSLPSEIGNLVGLLRLDLSNNLLSGSLPSGLFNLSNLLDLDLSSNQLSGTIPPELGSMPNLSTLDLGFNQLSGSIPPELGDLSKLSELHLNSNQLSDVIPSELGGLVNLSRLYLYDNLLTGTIPPSLGDLTLLWNLWLSGNQLTGSIPSELSQLNNMVWLRLADNQLSGTIPEELGALTGLWQLSLGNNQLTGEIPSALGGMTNLLILSLAGNQLSGPIPAQLGALTSLYELDLSSNQLSGTIPPELGSLVGLEFLLLDDNLLSGDVPDITSLIYLDLPDDLDPSYGLNLDYNALTVPLGYPDPLSDLQIFLHQYDPNWHTLQAFEQVIGSDGGVLTALDGSASFDIPAAALNDFAAFTFTPLPAPGDDPGVMVDAHHSFRLTAEYLLGDPVTTFNLPLTVTLTYTDTDVLGLSEASLALFYWDSGSSAWLDAVTTCESGAYTRDLVANSISLPLCHLSDFSVFGLPVQPTFLPLVVRRAGGTTVR